MLLVLNGGIIMEVRFVLFLTRDDDLQAQHERSVGMEGVGVLSVKGGSKCGRVPGRRFSSTSRKSSTAL